MANFTLVNVTKPDGVDLCEKFAVSCSEFLLINIVNL